MRDLKRQRAGLAAAGISLLPVPALAHGNDAAHWWSLDPWVIVPLVAGIAIYARGVQVLRRQVRQIDGRSNRPLRVLRAPALLAFCGASAALFLALIWPFDVLAAESFAAHMSQHMLLIALVAPLLVYAEPGIAAMHALPALRGIARSRGMRRILRVVLIPRVAFIVHGSIIWAWHAPVIFETGVESRFVHVLGHIAFLASGVQFWAAQRQLGRAGGDGYGIAALWTLGTMMHMGFLGGLITFAPRLLYESYAHAPLAALSPLEDQQLAGLIMWVPASIPYLVAGMGFILAWLHDADKHAPRLGWKD